MHIVQYLHAEMKLVSVQSSHRSSTELGDTDRLVGTGLVLGVDEIDGFILGDAEAIILGGDETDGFVLGDAEM